MKIKLIHRQILDEREEQLVNKAGMEAFSFLLFSSLALYVGSVVMSAGYNRLSNPLDCLPEFPTESCYLS